MKKTLSLLLTLALCSSAVYAGETGGEFQELYTIVESWATGYLGRAIALIFLLSVWAWALSEVLLWELWDVWLLPCA